jgi:hypothetical protein
VAATAAVVADQAAADQAAVVRVEAEVGQVGEAAGAARAVDQVGEAVVRAAEAADQAAEVVAAVDADSACGSAKRTAAVAQSTMGF